MSGTDKENIKRTADAAQDFANSAEGKKGWSIRFGAEPIDLHLTGKNNKGNAFVENKLGVTAGPGTVFNHNYVEILNPEGKVVKRVHGIGLNEQWQMGPAGRLVGMVVDGKFTPFSEDPIQAGDAHATEQNALQHSDKRSLLTNDPYAKTVFTGSEREVYQLYGSLVARTIQINNEAPAYSLLGQSGPNSNSFNSEMKRQLQQTAQVLGVKIEDFDAPGWDIGYDYPMSPEKAPPPAAKGTPLEQLKETIRRLEQTAAEQVSTLKTQGIDKDVTRTILPPAPSSFSSPSLW